MRIVILTFLLQFFLYATITGGIVFLFFYFSNANIDRIFKKAFALRGWEVINVASTNRTFPVTPKRKWWSKYIRRRYGGSTEVIQYCMVTFIHAGKQQTVLGAVYYAPFVKPQLFLETDIKKRLKTETPF